MKIVLCLFAYKDGSNKILTKLLRNFQDVYIQTDVYIQAANFRYNFVRKLTIFKKERWMTMQCSFCNNIQKRTDK